MTQCFFCHLYLTVIEKDAEANLYRFIELPFVPFDGLVLNFGDDESIIELDHRIWWRVNDECFDCYITHENISKCTCGPNDDCCVWKKDNWQNWKLEGVCRGYERLHQRPWIFEPEKYYMSKLKS